MSDRHALTLVTGADGFPVDPMDGVRRYEAERVHYERELAADLSVRVGGLIMISSAIGGSLRRWRAFRSLKVCP